MWWAPFETLALWVELSGCHGVCQSSPLRSRTQLSMTACTARGGSVTLTDLFSGLTTSTLADSVADVLPTSTPKCRPAPHGLVSSAQTLLGVTVDQKSHPTLPVPSALGAQMPWHPSGSHVFGASQGNVAV